MGMANLQRMAMQMQQEMMKATAEIEAARVEGSAGGGVVKATVTGKGDIVSIEIDPLAVDPADVAMLQDLIVAAVTEAQSSARQMAEARMASATGGMRLPGM
jgi:DNA-binding YbaB/EbfC family protein